jgi:NitT/TauT family transport system ATP-binding protein
MPALKALDRVSLDIADRCFVALLGPSGCGKTTLLRMIDGLLAPDEGTISIFGSPPRPGPETGFVFQSFRLVPWRTVLANVAFGLEANGLPKSEALSRACYYLELVGLADFAQAYPGELSGGMKQRVALARALATEPRVLLMDEPFANIDALTRELMQTELERLWLERKCIAVLVTHSIEEAIRLGDRVMLMSPRPGRISRAFDVPLPRPRSGYDIHAESDFIALRRHLWEEIQAMMCAR